MSGIVLRLKIFMDHKDLSIPELANILKYNSPQKLYRLFNTPLANPSCQIIEDISNAYEELNLNWLFTGKGSMLLGEKSELFYRDKYLQCMEEKEKLYQQIINKQ